MPNVETTPQSDKPISPNPNRAARDFLRREIADLAWAMGVQTNILQDYCALGQDVMIVHTVRQLRTTMKVLVEITRRLNELQREAQS